MPDSRRILLDVVEDIRIRSHGAAWRYLRPNGDIRKGGTPPRLANALECRKERLPVGVVGQPAEIDDRRF